MAQLRSILLKITGDSDDARAAIDDAKAKLAELGREHAEARVTLKEEAFRAQIARVEERLKRLGEQEPTPQVKIALGRAVEQLDRLHAKLAALTLKKHEVEVKVDVDRSRVDQIGDTIQKGLSGAVGAATEAGQTGAGIVGGLLRQLPLVGGAFTQMAVGAATSVPAFLAAAAAAGLLIAVVGALVVAVGTLAASFAAAVAGAGALAIAFAGALGPVGLLVGAFLTRLPNILAAVKERTQGTAAATTQLAGAQDNLRQQTTAAYRAWHDAIEAVKDDLLSVRDAQLGIERANLSLKQARQALKDFRAETGTADTTFDKLFKKFTDVDFRGDFSGIAKSLRAAGGPAISGDDTLKLQDLLLTIKERQQGVKHAQDTLHDSNVTLTRDEQTRARFLRDGIKAYEPYIAAQRQLTGTVQRQQTAWEKLTPAEQRFADALIRLKNQVTKALSPAFSAMLTGIERGLATLGDLLGDRGLRGAFTDIGRAIGDTFGAFASNLARPENRRTLVELAEGGAKLARVLGRAVFVDFVNLLLRIARVALPELLPLVKSVAGFIGDLADKAKDTHALRGVIHSLVDSFKRWIDFAREVARVVINFIKDAKDEGDGLLSRITRIVKRWADWLDSKSGQKDFKTFLHDAVGLVHDLYEIVNKTIEALQLMWQLSPAGLVHSLTNPGKAGDLLTPEQKDQLARRQAHAEAFAAPIQLPPALANKLPGLNKPTGGNEGGINLKNVRPRVAAAIADSIAPTWRAAAPALAGAAAAGGPPAAARGFIINGGINVQAPAGQAPDGRAAAVLLARELERRGGR